MIERILAFAIVSCIRVPSDLISKPSGSNEQLGLCEKMINLLMASSDSTMDKKMCVIGIPILSQQMISLYPEVRDLITHIIIFVCKTKNIINDPKINQCHFFLPSPSLPEEQSVFYPLNLCMNSPKQSTRDTILMVLLILASGSRGLSVAPERQIR